MKIDFASVNTDDFLLSERGDFVLINPRKSKHVWREDELHLRSLLCRKDGTVVSAGFPKFLNYGENDVHDAEFLAAMGRKAVRFTEKMDGTLIILSFIDGKPHLRTRGSHELGDFFDPVMWLLFNKYPKLLPFYKKDTFLGDICRRHYSLLFEYIAPGNRIVVKYDEPELVLIGRVDLDTLEPVLEYTSLAVIGDFLGVRTAPQHELPYTMQELGPIVRGWQDKEGVVAQFAGTLDGMNTKPRLLKIKASQYVKLHALKFKLEGKVHKLAFLLGARTVEDALFALGEMGIDHEAQQFILPELEAYIAKYQTVAAQWENFKFHALNARYRATMDVIGFSESAVRDVAGKRKWYVNAIREFVRLHALPEAFFAGAMKLYDGKEQDANIAVFAACLMEEPVNVVKNWVSNPNVALNEMLNIPVVED